MIEFNDVSKLYETDGETIHALDHVSMSIEKGEFVGVTGSSGSGKSTMMHIMGCLDAVTSGVYLLEGQPIENYSENELAEIRNRKIGFIFQNFNLLNRMTIEENVELPLIYRGVRSAERRRLVGEALGQVGLSDRRKHTPNSVSGGQQQRAAIARAIVTDPALILADEPTGNLDSRTGTDIMTLFSELNAAGRTIVLITHDAGVAAQTHRIVRLADGHIEEDSKETKNGAAIF
ncbi:MAG: ABC transporter ATP-binding protein [Clostridiales Family XIII bacterium]|jgi:putative ABC transport system ATP-binding protein|nr:ABC transporter ATP-binding protein [Clostridiales Family XIII bacterium]